MQHARAAWDELVHELGRWAAAGRAATLWWRDDDACRPTPALETLIEMSNRAGIPVAIAVVPEQAGPELADGLEACERSAVLQHGYAHRNHAPAAEKKAELGPHRPKAAMLEDLRQGRDRLAALFEGRFLPVLVPPWNRIGSDLLEELPRLGLSAISTYGARSQASPRPGLRQANCHADIIDWKGSRHFVGEATALGLITSHLVARRERRVDAAEATGVLTHHLNHDEGCWKFMRQLFERTAGLPAARWLAAGEVVWPA